MITKLIDQWTERIQNKPKSQREAMLDYYLEAGPDYAGWSKAFNMHFGYFSRGANPFNLEGMLNAMNKAVLDKLQLSSYHNNSVLDMGCGLGATIRYGLHRYPIKRITGITIVPWQVKEAQRLLEKEFYAYKASIELQDYQATSFSNNSFDGVYALESASHAAGSDKKAFLEEAYRVLKPGKTMVIADAYLKEKGDTNAFYAHCYERMCRYWAVPEFGNIHDLEKAMLEVGFEDIKIEEISWQIAPSVMYIPYIATKYFFSKLLPTFFMDEQRWHHFMAPIYALVVGAARRRFGYYIITAKK